VILLVLALIGLALTSTMLLTRLSRQCP